MADFIPLLLLLYGLVSVFKPDWMMAAHRRLNAAGTTTRPEDIEPSDGITALNYIAGLLFILFGLGFPCNVSNPDRYTHTLYLARHVQRASRERWFTIFDRLSDARRDRRDVSEPAERRPRGRESRDALM